MIRLEDVSKRYGASVAIDRVSLTIPRSKTTALIGPSGSGKSTLLDLIIGLESPDDGTIMIDADLLTSRSALRLRRRMGYVIQDGGLFPHLTARQNIDLMAKEAGWLLKRRGERVDELCAPRDQIRRGLEGHDSPRANDRRLARFRIAAGPLSFGAKRKCAKGVQLNPQNPHDLLVHEPLLLHRVPDGAGL